MHVRPQYCAAVTRPSQTVRWSRGTLSAKYARVTPSVPQPKPRISCAHTSEGTFQTRVYSSAPSTMRQCAKTSILR